MLEKLKYSTISDIYVNDLFFYSKDKEADLIRFHEDYGISYFPGKNRTSVYKYNGDIFIELPLSESLQCRPNDLLFSSTTLDKFEKNNHDEVLFVTDNKRIIGVVHIVDYNNEFIYFEFYKLIFYFENMLRDFLVKKEETNDSLLEWMKEYGAKKGKSYWQRQYDKYVPQDKPQKLQDLKERRINLKPFQSFLMSDILQFGISKKYFSKKIKQNIEDIKMLRNRIAHSTDFTGKTDSVVSKSDGTLYKIDELKKFIKEIRSFFEAYEELEELINQ